MAIVTEIRFQVSRPFPVGYVHLPKRPRRAPKNEFRNDGAIIPHAWKDITQDEVRKAIEHRYPQTQWRLEGYVLIRQYDDEAAPADIR